MHTDDCHLSMLEWNRMKYLFECISKPLYIYLYIYKKKTQKNKWMDVVTDAMRPSAKSKKKNPKVVEATGEEMRSLQIISKPYFRGISFLFGSVNAANSSVLQKIKTAVLVTWHSERGVGGLQWGDFNWRHWMSSCCAWGTFFFFFHQQEEIGGLIVF